MKIIKHGPKNSIKYELTKAEHQFLRDHWREMTDKQLLAAFNERFGCEMTFGYLRQYKRANDLIYQAQPAWTKEEVEFLKANYQRMGNVEMAAHFGWAGDQAGRKYGEKRIWKKMKQLGLKRSPESILKLQSACGKRVAKRGVEERKKAGKAATFTPHAKKEGQRWQTKNGTWMIKHQGKIKFLARHLWEQAHGRIPRGFMVGHYNGDRTDTRLENLCLLTKEINARRNATRHIVEEPGDNWIAGIMSHGNPELREKIKEHPELIELQRQRILLNRKINKIEKNGK